MTVEVARVVIVLCSRSVKVDIYIYIVIHEKHRRECVGAMRCWSLHLDMTCDGSHMYEPAPEIVGSHNVCPISHAKWCMLTA